MIFTGGITQTGKNISFNSPFSNDFYSLRDDSAILTFHLNFGKDAVPEGLFESNIFDSLSKYKFAYNTFFQNDKYVGLNYMNKGRCSIAIFDFKSHKMISSEKDSLNELLRSWIYLNDSVFVTLIDVKRMKKISAYNVKLLNELIPGWINKIKTAKNNTSPILFFFKLKKKIIDNAQL